MSERKKIVIGNWKMNLNVSESVRLAEDIVKKIDGKETEVVVCPSVLAIYPVAEKIKNTNILLGSQNLAEEEKGSYTGETSVTSLKSFVKYSIVGHSERRNLYGESDKIVAKKAEIAIRHDVAPIICVGETLQQKQDRLSKVVVLSQLEASCKHLTKEEISECIIAYEPVWAVGSDRVCEGKDAELMALEMRGLLKALYGEKSASQLRILYGGDVKPENVSEFTKLENIDGVLVGRASLEADSFAKIVKSFG